MVRFVGNGVVEADDFGAQFEFSRVGDVGVTDWSGDGVFTSGG